MNLTPRQQWTQNITAVSVGKEIAEKAFSLQVEYLAAIFRMLPKKTLKAVVLAALDRATL